MIHWAWLIPTFIAGTAFGWTNARFFYRVILPGVLEQYNKHTFVSGCIGPSGPPGDPNLN